MASHQSQRLAAASRILIVAAAWLLAGLPAAALAGTNPIVYQVNRVIGAGSVVGFVETDGTLGTLVPANLLDWNLLVDDGLNSVTVMERGNPGDEFVEGPTLTATPTDLLFDFDGSGIFALINDGQGWCVDGAASSATSLCIGVPGVEALNVLQVLNVPQAGVQSIANVDGIIDVGVDILPGHDPNFINPAEAGKLPVAIFGSEDFDIVADGYDALAFGPDLAGVFAWAGSEVSDLDNDGILDLTLWFRTEESGIAFGDVEACVVGTTSIGQVFRGCDAITPVACGLGFELALLLPPLVWLRKRRARRAA